MPRPLSKKDIDILEERGYWQASSFLYKKVKQLTRKKLPLRIGLIKHAHKIIFETAEQPDIAGKYRKDNPEIKRIDGTLLKISHWHNIPNDMAGLDEELRETTKNLASPKTRLDYQKVVTVAARLSHRFTRIHPFENGNGRTSRLLLGAILIRAGLYEVAIKKEKSEYLRAMRQADNGDFSLLENIIFDGLIENKKKQYQLQLRKQTEKAKFNRRKNRIYG